MICLLTDMIHSGKPINEPPNHLFDDFYCVAKFLFYG